MDKCDELGNISNLIEIDKRLLYSDPIISTPFHKEIFIIFADDIASGRLSPYIENHINNNIFPLYSNTHSNSYCGILMRNKIDAVRSKIKKYMNVQNWQKILFTGNGTTGGFNHLINLIDFDYYSQVNIYISLYEHYSNHLPWLELQKRKSNITVHIIPFINFVL